MSASLLMSTALMADQSSASFRKWVEASFLSEEATAAKPGLHELKSGDWGTLKLDRSVLDTPLKIGQVEFKIGLGTHASSSIEARLPAKAKSFSAKIGMDDNRDTHGKSGCAVFAVEADGKELFRSGVCRCGDAPIPISVELSGAKSLVLHVLTAPGADNGYAHADWADAKVELEDGKSITLSEIGAGRGSAQLPVSFTFDGKPSGELLSGWRRELKSTPEKNGRTLHSIIWTDPASGLELRCELKVFSKHPAAEWTVYLKNNGSSDSPLIEKLLPLDLPLNIEHDDATLHRAHGSTCGPLDFLPIDEKLSKQAQIDIAPNGGRSSDGVLPFFNLEWDNGGLAGAIGWSGQWSMRVKRSGRNLNVSAGQQTVHLKLHPGEEIRSPKILLVSWEGKDYLSGCNSLRRLILDQYSPRIDGKLAIPPVTENTWFIFNQGNDVTEANQKAHMPSMAESGVEGYWLDAGWFEGGWPAGAGNWVPKKAAFPSGLKPVGDEAHKLGMKFVLWFEPERVTSNSLVAKEHPEWVMHHPGEAAWGALFNLGDPAANKWITEYFSKCISDWGIDVLRIDFNIAPLPFWKADDAPDRQGISEIRYIEGLYKMWDTLLKRHHGLTIDNCASGGRRIDLETISLSYPLWQSDTQCGGRAMPAQDQIQNAGLSLYVPLHAAGVWAFDTYNFRSVATTGCSICVDISKDKAKLNAAKKMLEEVKSLRPYYLGDYYLLTEIVQGEGSWCGWQYDRPDMGEGFLTLFRRPDSIFCAADITLRGLDVEASYTVSDADSGLESVKSGKELLTGLRIELPKTGCVLLRYKKRS